ncbi:MAG: hypothetical protein ACI4U2_03145 [Christensenellaceae bacterium]
MSRGEREGIMAEETKRMEQLSFEEMIERMDAMQAELKKAQAEGNDSERQAAIGMIAKIESQKNALKELHEREEIYEATRKTIGLIEEASAEIAEGKAGREGLPTELDGAFSQLEALLASLREERKLRLGQLITDRNANVNLGFCEESIQKLEELEGALLRVRNRLLFVRSVNG